MALEFPTNPSNGQVYGQYTYDGSYKVWRSTPDLASGLPAGTILQWGTNTAPANWLICDGTAVSRATYASLYAAIGTNFGSGDGATTFNLPDLRGRVAIGRDSTQTEFDLIGETGGNKATAKYGSGTTTGFGTVYSDSLGATGDATSSNLPPYQVVNHIIKISASVTSSDSDLASRVGILENKFNTGQNDAPAGAIVQWAADVAPTNWLICDGAAVSRATWPSLFSAIGTTYGSGDGSTTFNLPNLKGRVGVGRDSSQTEFDTLGETGGAKTHTLTTAEMPSHTHTGTTASSGAHTHDIAQKYRDGSDAHTHGSANGKMAQAGASAGWTDTSGAPAAALSAGAHTHTFTTDATGSGGAHNNLQPYIVLNYIIKATAGVSTNDSTFITRVGAVETRAANLEINSPNYIINGAMDINQRGLNSTGVTTQQYTLDRWLFAPNTGTVTQSYQAFTPGSGPASSIQPIGYLRTVTSGQSAAGAWTIINNNIEDVRALSGKTVTVSFYAKASTNGIAMAHEFSQNYGTGGSPSAALDVPIPSNGSSKFTLTTSWARYSYTMTLPSLSGKTLGTTPNTSYTVSRFWLSAGTDANARTSSLGIQNGTVDLWGVQVEECSYATPFRRNSPNIQAELAACQRYYQSWGGNSTNERIGPSFNYSTTQARCALQAMVPMRVTPALSVSAVSHWGVEQPGGITACTSISLDQPSPRNFGILFNTSGGLTSGYGSQICGTGTTAAYIAFSAEF